MKSKTLFFILTAIISITQLTAQTFEEYKKQKEAELQAFKQKQNEFINRMQNEFDEYVKQKDQEFSKYLKTQWEQFEIFKGTELPKKPKPPVIPEYKPEPDKQEAWKKIPIIKPSLNIKAEISGEIIKPLIQNSDKIEFNQTDLIVRFFGNQLSFDYDQKLNIDPPKTINESSISDYWEKLSCTNYNHLIDQLQAYKSIMNLNDWAYYLLLQKFSQAVYPESETGADLMLWVLLIRSGYKARIAFENNQICLLVPSYYTIYARNFLKSDGLNYYLMRDLKTNNLYTYNKDYPETNKILDFNINNPLNFAEKVNHKSFNFTFKGKPYSLNIKYNQNLINFYSDYPQVNISVYFDAAVSLETKESIVECLKPIINNMTETEAISFLLHFVQTSFDYQTDEKQFNKEKFFFPEEVFYYPYSDCEDRSVLFAYLVKELLNNKVIGIEYPGHIATAVKLNQDAEGDYLVYDGEKYIIADATFENAPLGMTMPEYKGKEAKIIELDNYKYTGHNNKFFWDLVSKSGGYHGNNLQDIVFDDEGNAYLTGYFMGDAEFGDQTKKTDSDQAVRSVFLVKYDKNGNILWAENASGNKSATAYAIVRDNNNNLYIAGSFSSKLEFEKDGTALQCKNDNNDIFIAKYNNEGKLIWAKKAGLDTFPQDNYLTYMTNFTTDGINKGTAFYSENENFNNYGLYLNPDGLLYLIGSFSNTTGLNLSKLSLEISDGKELNLSESLKAENDKLLADNYEVNIAGLFSLLNLMKYNGLKIEGKDVQITLDKYNPEFREKYSSVYQDIGNINLLINEDGIISIKTKNGKSVKFDKMKVNSNSKVKITSFESGDAQIDILSGITVGKLVIWFDLNFVKMFKETGNLLIDFDSDHSQKVVNIKEDILN